MPLGGLNWFFISRGSHFISFLRACVIPFGLFAWCLLTRLLLRFEVIKHGFSHGEAKVSYIHTLRLFCVRIGWLHRGSPFQKRFFPAVCDENCPHHKKIGLLIICFDERIQIPKENKHFFFSFDSNRNPIAVNALLWYRKWNDFHSRIYFFFVRLDFHRWI